MSEPASSIPHESSRPRDAGPSESAVTLRRLRWMAILVALVMAVLLDQSRQAFYPFLRDWPGRILQGTLVLFSLIFLIGALFHVIDKMQRKLERQNRELLALHEAGLDVHSELALEPLFQKVVDQARLLLDARYGALSLIDGQNRIEVFTVSGITPEQRARLGDPPVGHGLLGVVLHEGHRLRLPDISKDPRSVGFPPNHPPMRSLLAVPLPCKGPFRGNLYLAEKQGEPEFTGEDEETLTRFAVKVALAIDNAHLHRQLNTLAVAEERMRIAHEMHDGLAQVLAYVNTKAQAVREFLRGGRNEEAERHLEQLAAAAREIYADVRESIIGLRSAGSGRTMSEAMAEYVASWERQAGIECDLAVDPELRLAAGPELQLLRIVQEAMANVRKHAAAKRVEVRIERLDGRVVATVEDDGAGFNPAETRRSEFPRFGLATMRERAESIGGSVQLDTAPGAGTRVRVEIPYPAPNQSPAEGRTS
ncbi:MAG TPA: GAF domain-containing sensor histidine kinase [Thermoanaerobaculia bacterium]|nr:GAF domain-containing sensor histidine kinase [Thermoanaerobaculia bacterium]